MREGYLYLLEASYNGDPHSLDIMDSAIGPPFLFLLYLSLFSLIFDATASSTTQQDETSSHKADEESAASTLGCIHPSSARRPYESICSRL